MSMPGLVADDADDAVDDNAGRDEVTDVMSSKETADETAEFAGVLKCFDASLTFQNYT